MITDFSITYSINIKNNSCLFSQNVDSWALLIIWALNIIEIIDVTYRRKQ